MRQFMSALLLIVLGGGALFWLPLTPLSAGGALLVLVAGVSLIRRRKR
jgi:LPXTG-motif cell wall-anchored protein